MDPLHKPRRPTAAPGHGKDSRDKPVRQHFRGIRTFVRLGQGLHHPRARATRNECVTDRRSRAASFSRSIFGSCGIAELAEFRQGRITIGHPPTDVLGCWRWFTFENRRHGPFHSLRGDWSDHHRTIRPPLRNRPLPSDCSRSAVRENRAFARNPRPSRLRTMPLIETGSQSHQGGDRNAA